MLKRVIVAAALVLGAAQAGAVELKLLVGGAMSEPFHEIGSHAQLSGP